MNEILAMNVAYGLVALCVVYKLAYLTSLGSLYPLQILLPMRLACVVLGTIILLKAKGRFDGSDPAEWLDIIRELAWCFVLMPVISLVSKFRPKPQ